MGPTCWLWLWLIGMAQPAVACRRLWPESSGRPWVFAKGDREILWGKGRGSSVITFSTSALFKSTPFSPSSLIGRSSDERIRDGCSSLALPLFLSSRSFSSSTSFILGGAVRVGYEGGLPSEFQGHLVRFPRQAVGEWQLHPAFTGPIFWYRNYLHRISSFLMQTSLDGGRLLPSLSPLQLRQEEDPVEEQGVRACVRCVL